MCPFASVIDDVSDYIFEKWELFWTLHVNVEIHHEFS
jgi:hypothetical protein